jgi:hypothetical protein
MTRTVNDAAGSVRDSVVTVVLRPSSVGIKNATIRTITRHIRHRAYAAPSSLPSRPVRAPIIFDSHGGRAEDHGDHGGSGAADG